ncbi:WG repeat-containing protein [Bacteroides gallinaceum]|uniref:WG repeat-containing protein n=1 Tax=Bacteroides gallinaceum TaxID=1462571 RepID=UPI0025AAC6D7|nr:WG repeat-containing protein [Bacteroides gallinaceum]MDN0080897.1 WG repeat-containing protein [Bacteroides gallinaceum]
MKLEPFEQEGKVGFKDDCKIIIPAIYESASYFHDGHAVVRLNGLSGVIDSKGKIVIPNQYDDITHLFEKYFCIRINVGADWNCGIIDIDGNSIIEPSYKVICGKDKRYFLCYKTAQSKAKDLDKYPQGEAYEYENLGNCVWCNLEGKVLTSLEVVNSFASLVVKNEKGKLGVINQNGKLIVDFIYDTVEPCTNDVFAVSVITEKGTSYSVINSNGNTILPSKNEAYEFSDGFFYEQKDEKTKWYSITGKLVFEGEAIPLSSDYIAVSKNKKWGVIDKKGTKVINFLYSEIALLHDCFIVLREDKIGLIDLNGKIIVDTIYNSIECVTINNTPFRLGCKKDLIHYYGLGLTDTNFSGYCLEYEFDTNGHLDYNGHKCDRLERNVIKVSKSFYASTFSICITPHIEFDLSKPLILTTDEYQELYSHDEGIMANGRFSKIEQITQVCFVVKTDEQYGVYRIDTDSLIIPIEYDQIKFMGGHTVLLRKKEFWGAHDLLLDSNALKILLKVSIPCENLELKILNSTQTIFGAKKQYKNYKDELEPYYTLLGKDGQEYADFKFHYCLDSQFKRYDNRHLLTSQNGKYGFVTISGYTSIPFIYDEITERKGGNFNVRINESWGVMDINGRELMPVKYAAPIPLIITKPENVVFDYDDLKENNNYENRVITNDQGLTILKDARSGFYGCVDLNGKEVVPTIFEHLMFSGDERVLFWGIRGHYDKYSSRSFFSNVKSAKWGCINKNGKIIIDAKYDCFKLVDRYILGGRDGSMLGKGVHGSTYYESEYGGVYDMFDFDGNLLIGGFREFKLLSSPDLFLFKFGGFWKQDCEDYDEWGNAIYYYSYHFEKGNSRWLAVDKDFNSIILQNNGKKKSFYKHIGTITKTKENDKTVNYWNMPLEVFSINEPYIDKGVMICGNDSEQYAVCISDGFQSSKYKRIEMIDEKTFFFTEIINGKELVGIASLSKNTSDIRIIDPINENTSILTHPVDGFVFGISEIDNSNCKVSLYNINENGFTPIPAISSVNERTLLDMIKKGLLHISLSDAEMNLKRISVIKKDVFDKAFGALVSEVETASPKSSLISPYWYTEDFRLLKLNNQYDDNYQDYRDSPDYMRDTWDAMTDGMYGDMPDGFDGDFDFLGR